MRMIRLKYDALAGSSELPLDIDGMVMMRPMTERPFAARLIAPVLTSTSPIPSTKKP